MSILELIIEEGLAINHITRNQEGMASRTIEAKGGKMVGAM